MTLSSRFAIDILFVIGGAFLAVVAMAFAAPVAGWIAFGVAIGLLVIALGGVALTRNTSHRVGYGLLAAVSAWTLIATMVFSGTALTWLVLASGIGLGVFALGDLTAHEVTTENVVHRLEIVSTPSEMSHRTSA